MGTEDGPLEARAIAVGAGAGVMVKGPAPQRRSRSSVDLSAEQRALAAIRQSDSSNALVILMRAYGPKITAFAERMVRQRELAHDVRQQVFLDAFQGLDSFKGHSTLWSWLCGITYHRCVDELRRRGRWDTVEDAGTGDAFLPDLTTEVIPDELAKRLALERCLSKLQPSLRSQLLLRCFFGLSYSEIAELVGVQSATVQVRISRLLPELRRCLRTEGVAR